MWRARIGWVSLAHAGTLWLCGEVLAKQHDEWQVGRRYFSAESLAKLPSMAKEEVTAALPALV